MAALAAVPGDRRGRGRADVAALAGGAVRRSRPAASVLGAERAAGRLSRPDHGGLRHRDADGPRVAVRGFGDRHRRVRVRLHCLRRQLRPRLHQRAAGRGDAGDGARDLRLGLAAVARRLGHGRARLQRGDRARQRAVLVVVGGLGGELRHGGGADDPAPPADQGAVRAGSPGAGHGGGGGGRHLRSVRSGAVRRRVRADRAARGARSQGGRRDLHRRGHAVGVARRVRQRRHPGRVDVHDGRPAGRHLDLDRQRSRSGARQRVDQPGGARGAGGGHDRCVPVAAGPGADGGPDGRLRPGGRVCGAAAGGAVRRRAAGRALGARGAAGGAGGALRRPARGGDGQPRRGGVDGHRGVAAGRAPGGAAAGRVDRRDAPRGVAAPLTGLSGGRSRSRYRNTPMYGRFRCSWSRSSP